MSAELELATTGEAAAIAALRVATAAALTARFGKGPWSGNVTERGVLWDMRRGKVFVMRGGSKLVATLTLSTRKPWSIDRKYFSACDRPIYLTAMAIGPDSQRQGLGRRCLEDAQKIVKQWPGVTIRLDAYDAEAGAGEFYRKCGFREVGRASYRNVPLIYFEMLL